MGRAKMWGQWARLTAPWGCRGAICKRWQGYERLSAAGVSCAVSSPGQGGNAFSRRVGEVVVGCVAASDRWQSRVVPDERSGSRAMRRFLRLANVAQVYPDITPNVANRCFLCRVVGGGAERCERGVRAVEMQRMPGRRSPIPDNPLTVAYGWGAASGAGPCFRFDGCVRG